MSEPSNVPTTLADGQAEEVLLSCMMEDMPRLWDKYGRRLHDELFHHPANRMVAHAMIDMHVSAERIDLVMLTNWMREKGTLDRVGGERRITGLFVKCQQSLGAVTMVGHYLEVLEGFAARRLLLAQAEEIADAARDFTTDWKDCLLRAEAALAGLHEQTSHDGMLHVSKIIPAVLTEIEQTTARKGHVTGGLATGMTSFDRITMGLKPGLHIIAARPSKGKTTVLMQQALHITMGFGDYPEYDQPALPGAIFSLETDNVALTKRGLLNLAELNLQRIRDGQMSRDQMEKLKDGAQRMMASQMHIESCFALSIQDFRSKARMLVRKLGLKVIWIDYLQLMSSASKRAQDNRNLEVAEISFGLKQAALELKIPIIVLAQLNRDGDVARPKLVHLRECGQIEQDADTISMICEPPEWAGKDDMEDAPWKYLGLDVVKHKDGPTTSGGDPLVLRFDDEFFRLTSMDAKLFSNNPEQRQGGSQGSDGQKWSADRPKRGRGRPRKEAEPPEDDGFFDD